MSPLTLIIVEVLYRPVYNILILFLQVFGGNLGRAIIFLTIVVRLLLLKSSMAGTQMQSSMSGLQPKMQEVQDRYKDDPKKMQEEMMKILKKDGV
jgi:YidC/Oxa1 family membrane protein insertase